MTIAEPMTALTDYLVSAFAWSWGGLLLRARVTAARVFGLSLLATGVAAALGGTLHGLGPTWGSALRANAWLATYVAIGVANLLLVSAAILAWAPRRFQTALLGLVGLRFVVFLFLLSSWMTFRPVIYDIMGTFALLLALALLSRDAPRAQVRLLVAAVAVSAFGACVQASGVGLHKHMNHNDLFHLIEIGGLYCFYRLARRLDEAHAA
jgi:hypothetical protein